MRHSIARLRRRLRALTRRPALEREMDDEMRFHVEMEAAELIRAGIPAAEAWRRARVAFGGVERFKEEARDARIGRALEELVADVRYALRGLRRSPGFALTAILTLALGIGATSAVFSAISAVLLAPLPYPTPERLVRIYEQNSPTNRWTISNADWQAIKEQQRSFESVALLEPGGAALSTGGQAEWVRVGRVTSGFFRTLGVQLVRGGGFQDGDDVLGAPPRVIVSQDFWERYFGVGDPIGRTLMLDRVSYTVVGVLPRGVSEYAGMEAGVWPILQLPTPSRRGPFGFVGIGRLRDGVTLDAAARDLAGISERIFPLWASGFQDRTARLTPYSLHEVIVGDASRPLTVLAIAVGLVLLIAIANVANLMLVRATGRRREIAVRSALGARRSRLARLLLTESLVLGGLGGVVGLAVAVLGLRALSVVGPELPRLHEASLDLRAVVFTAMAALVSGAIVGIYPLAFGMSRSLGSDMRSGERGSGTARSAQLFQGALVAAEFALALPLLLAAGLLLHSFAKLQRVDPGFEARNLLTSHISRPATADSEPATVLRFWDDARRRVREVPGVVEAGLATSLPPDNYGETNNFDLLEKPVPPGGAEPVAPWSWVTPELFAALGVPLVEGRLFDEADDADAPPVVLVSHAWARRYFPGESAIGKRMYVGGCRECVPSTVVGVVGDVKYEGLAGSGEAVYESVLQAPQSSLYLVVRTAVAPSSVVSPIRERLRSLDPDVPVRDLTTMEERLATSIANPRRLTWLLGAFAAAAVVLAALGVFGVMSYVVAQQRKEIGVRIALGADRAAVVGMVVRRGMIRATAGLALGVLVSLQGMPVLQAVLFEVSATDAATVVATSLLLLAVALAACWLPGRRAARIQPMEALNIE
ncbi:MAG TPA: ABC transporter permease [Gemmatimonadaceae bacterium]|nr:ABC transporter permease [Gemmatimonadaceae bacterium]